MLRGLQFPEVKPGDVTMLKTIHKDLARRPYRRLFTCDVRLGDDLGVVRCMGVEYSGSEAQEAWKRDFQRFRESGTVLSYSEHIRSSKTAQLVAIGRARVPFLFFSGDFEPLASFKNDVGETVQRYLRTLVTQLSCASDCELWADRARGVLCRGPEGPPCRIQHEALSLKAKLSTDAKLLRGDVLEAYLFTLYPKQIIEVSSLPLDWVEADMINPKANLIDITLDIDNVFSPPSHSNYTSSLSPSLLIEDECSIFSWPEHPFSLSRQEAEQAYEEFDEALSDWAEADVTNPETNSIGTPLDADNAFSPPFLANCTSSPPLCMTDEGCTFSSSYHSSSFGGQQGEQDHEDVNSHEAPPKWAEVDVTDPGVNSLHTALDVDNAFSPPLHSRCISSSSWLDLTQDEGSTFSSSGHSSPFNGPQSEQVIGDDNILEVPPSDYADLDLRTGLGSSPGRFAKHSIVAKDTYPNVQSIEDPMDLKAEVQVQSFEPPLSTARKNTVSIKSEHRKKPRRRKRRSVLSPQPTSTPTSPPSTSFPSTSIRGKSATLVSGNSTKNHKDQSTSHAHSHNTDTTTNSHSHNVHITNTHHHHHHNRPRPRRWSITKFMHQITRVPVFWHPYWYHFAHSSFGWVHGWWDWTAWPRWDWNWGS
ncbi:hypothetical protein V5O48_014384 [Marasmius crinis-equi]|uniref:Uncharacterized protein n=1 Tax=Marasmius crinis-equi TaxID=585013 RepID=A0ABR3EXT5_9AGAR